MSKFEIIITGEFKGKKAISECFYGNPTKSQILRDIRLCIKHEVTKNYYPVKKIKVKKRFLKKDSAE